MKAVIIFLLIVCFFACDAKTCSPENCLDIVNSANSDSCHVGFYECESTKNVTDKNFTNIAANASWYVFRDESSEFDQVALNITWLLPNDAHIHAISGFEVLIGSSNANSPISYQVYFCLDHLSAGQHLPTAFNFDCYGRRASSRIDPDDMVDVSITLLQNSKYFLHSFLMLAIPSCENEAMHGVELCANQHQSHFYAVNVFCHNHSIVCNYSVPLQEDQAVEFIICNDTHKLQLCESALRTAQSKGLATFNIPNRLLSYRNLTIVMLGPSGISFKKDLTLNCNVIGKIPAIILLSAMVLVTACVATRTFYILKRHVNTQTNIIHSANCTVYLLFVPDTPQHQQVVLYFADFLQDGLGFNVIFHLWEQDKVHEDSVRWMERSLKTAQHVIFVWSPEAKKICNGAADASAEMFLPIYKQAKQEKQDKNETKYHFVSFDYHAVEPPKLGSKKVSHFKLMKDFNLFYESLTGLRGHLGKFYLMTDSGQRLNRLLETFNFSTVKHKRIFGNLKNNL